MSVVQYMASVLLCYQPTPNSTPTPTPPQSTCLLGVKACAQFQWQTFYPINLSI